MAKPNFSLNTNFKVCARIKPLEYTSRMLEVNNDSIVTIRDISNKTNNEKQQFHFNKVFDQNSKQETVFNYIAENAINKALEGTNCCVLSYGQTGAGKSYTMFGDDDKPSPGAINLYSDSKKDKKGIIAKTVEHLLRKNNEMEGVRELVLTCSFIEIYLDQVRDLARNYSDRNIGNSNQKRSIGSITNTTSYETENLEIYEHANGQVLVRNARSATIKSVEEVQELLASGFAVREKSAGKESQIWSRSHSVFTINIVQKEIENEDLPFPKSMIQFVDLAGSERIAKSITEGQNKFQEAVLIMSHLTSLYKVLAAIATNSKNIPYRDSKLTKILYNCLTPYNNIIMLAHLHPAEANFEETLNTLQFVERCKNVDFKDKRGLGGNNSGMEDSNYAAATNASNDKLWKKMTDEIADLKNKMENLQKDHRAKLDKIQSYLGLEIDLEKVNSNTLSKEAQILTQLRNTHVENQNLKATIMQTEETFEIMRKEFEDERKEFFHKQSKMESNNVELREAMKKNTDKLITTRNKDEDDLKRQIQVLTEENKKLSGHNTQLLQEKTQALMNFSSNLDIKTRTVNQTMDMKSIGKKEAELEYRGEVTLLKQDYRKVAEGLKDQYEHWLKLKNEEMERYAEKAQEYQRKKKEQIEAMRTELLELHNVCQKQEKIIEKVENGSYSGGLRSFFIPSKDKPLAPTRQKYPQLYKFLDEKKPELTTQTFFRIRDTTDFYPPFERTALSPPGRTMTKFSATMNNTGFSNFSKSADKAKITRPDQVNLDLNINKLHIEDLKRYTDSLRDFCRRLKDNEKELKVQADKYVELNVYGDIHEIIREKDKYKELYRDQSRKNHDNKITIESQGRILRSGSKTQTLSKTRPGTSGWE